MTKTTRNKKERSPNKGSFLLSSKIISIEAIDIYIQFVEMYELPSLKRLSNLKWAATELKAALIKNDIPPLVTISRFSEKMCQYANLNTRNKHIFWDAYDLALVIDDMLTNG